MPFQIHALPASDFAPLFNLDDNALTQLNARRVVATAKPGFPCRVSLQDAEEGEALVLVHFVHQPAETPYQSGHAIFVREGAETANVQVGEVPNLFQHRLLSVRAFSRAGDMIDAGVVKGSELEAALERHLSPPSVSYLHIHNAAPGCFAARVTRPGEPAPAYQRPAWLDR